MENSRGWSKEGEDNPISQKGHDHRFPGFADYDLYRLPVED